ncbi:ChrA protein [Paenibacillus yonginensis]|uniref:ChrA protein n=1 Tax=Paenibacillus yonginensis TaxID=1462996 RepID=A0A1B1N6T8_9BACL|nr:chromate transporter [Paenibacillus yonginensis]ANS77150.1 ChrA protein [Paenibacillus yonginensis]
MVEEHERDQGEDRPSGKLAALNEIWRVSFKLGLTSFGGPIAHLGYFHHEYVRQRKWLDERNYADLIALCQLLPGPASSQAGIGIGILRAGLLGGLVAWLGFTLPSVVMLVLFAYLLKGIGLSDAGWIHGLKIVAVVIVLQAVLSMGQKLANDRNKATIAVLALAVTLVWQTAVSQVLLMIAAAGIGVLWFRKEATAAPTELSVPLSRRAAFISLVIFLVLLVGLPLLRESSGNLWLAMFDSFYRSGSLVFGGGHVVLPLLEREVVPNDWLSAGEFLAGYGAAQAVPGPLFTFAAYLGASMLGTAGAVWATLAIFLPAFLLVAGVLPFWSGLRSNRKMQGAIIGVNAAVVGILLAALYHPVFTSAILEANDLVFAAVLFLLLVFWKLPPWLVVLAGAAGGELLVLI